MNKNLESANYYALKALLNFRNSLDYDSTLSAVNMQSLEHRRYYQSLVLLFKRIKGNGPDFISDLFEPRTLRYNLRNSDHNLTQPSYNNRYHHNSFTYKASCQGICGISFLLTLKDRLSWVNFVNNLINFRASCKCSFCQEVFLYLRVFHRYLRFIYLFFI